MRPKIAWKSNTLWLRPQKRDGNSGLMESGVQWNYDNLKYYDNFALRLWRKRALLFAIRVTETSLLLSVCTSCLACCDVTAPLTALASWEGLGLPPGIKMIAPISSMCTMKYVDLLRYIGFGHEKEIATSDVWNTTGGNKESVPLSQDEKRGRNSERATSRKRATVKVLVHLKVLKCAL